MIHRTKGFTLIELVMVIVIIGVLAAFAIPRFADLSTESRIASLKGLAGALRSSLATGRSLCALSPSTCSFTDDGGSFRYFMFDGQQIYTHYGAPTGWGRFGVDDGQGSIGDLTDISDDFEYQPHVGGSFETRYELRNAPDPANCYVSYQMVFNSSRVDITVIDSGC